MTERKDELNLHTAMYGVVQAARVFVDTYDKGQNLIGPLEKLAQALDELAERAKPEGGGDAAAGSDTGAEST